MIGRIGILKNYTFDIFNLLTDQRSTGYMFQFLPPFLLGGIANAKYQIQMNIAFIILYRTPSEPQTKVQTRTSNPNLDWTSSPYLDRTLTKPWPNLDQTLTKPQLTLTEIRLNLDRSSTKPQPNFNLTSTKPWLYHNQTLTELQPNLDGTLTKPNVK